MDTWDVTKLESVILSKHGNPQTTTDVRYPHCRTFTSHLLTWLLQIVCKFFIEAIESQKYVVLCKHTLLLSAL